MFSPPAGLPSTLRRHFWDVDFDALRWPAQRDFVIKRVLQAGSWDAVTWLRQQLSPAELRRWLLDRHGVGLPPERLRYWQLILDLPAADVDQWVDAARRSIWGARLGRPDERGSHGSGIHR